MEENISFCGINCLSCPAYVAKKTDNNDLRIKTAKKWSDIGFEITPEQVNCDGFELPLHKSGGFLIHRQLLSR